MPLNEKQKLSDKHVNGLSSFNMISIYLTMSAILALLSPFHLATIIQFTLNLASLVVVRIVQKKTIQNFIVCYSIVLFCLIVSTQPMPTGPTINYYWAITFIYLLIGFRLFYLFLMSFIVLISHFVYKYITVGSLEALIFSSSGFVLLIYLFITHISLGMFIYMTCLAISQVTTYYCLNNLELFDAFSSRLTNLEILAFSRIPIAILLSRNLRLSYKQHMFILLRLMKSTKRSNVLLDLLGSSTYQLYINNRNVNINIPNGQSINEEKNTDLSVFVSLEEWHEDFVNCISVKHNKIQKLLQGVLHQIVIEAHPNKELSEALVHKRFFKWSNKQAQFLLDTHNSKIPHNIYISLRNGRLRVPLWSSSDVSQKLSLPQEINDIVHVVDKKLFKFLVPINQKLLAQLPVTKPNFALLQNISIKNISIREKIKAVEKIIKTMKKDSKKPSNQAKDKVNITLELVRHLRPQSIKLKTYPMAWSDGSRLVPLQKFFFKIIMDITLISQDSISFPRNKKFRTTLNALTQKIKELNSEKESFQSSLLLSTSIESVLSRYMSVKRLWIYMKNALYFVIPSHLPEVEYMPNSNMFGSFIDEKIERWYLVWFCSIQAVFYRLLRKVHICLFLLQLSYYVLSVAVEGYIMYKLENRIMLRNHIITGVILIAIYIVMVLSVTCTVTSNDPDTNYILKIRYFLLSIFNVVIAISFHFGSSVCQNDHDEKMKHKPLFTMLKSIKEACLFVSLIGFPILNFCTEKLMVSIIFVMAIVIFLIAPLVSANLVLWPMWNIFALLDSYKHETNIFTLHSMATLIHIYAPCLIIQFVINKAVHGAMRRLFARYVIMYMIYLDALKNSLHNVSND